jgi:hypothetical protein
MHQLSVGGTLVMPIGEPSSVQNLVKVRRLSEDDFAQEDLGPVRFVPLIGEHGWGDGAASRAEAAKIRRPAGTAAGPDLFLSQRPGVPPRP